MSKRVKWKGIFRSYFNMPLILILVLVPANALIFWMDTQCGVIMAVFLIAYAIIAVYLRVQGKPLFLNEQVSFATQYGQVQKRSLSQCRITPR